MLLLCLRREEEAYSGAGEGSEQQRGSGDVSDRREQSANRGGHANDGIAGAGNDFLRLSETNVR